MVRLHTRQRRRLASYGQELFARMRGGLRSTVMRALSEAYPGEATPPAQFLMRLRVVASGLCAPIPSAKEPAPEGGQVLEMPVAALDPEHRGAHLPRQLRRKKFGKRQQEPIPPATGVDVFADSWLSDRIGWRRRTSVKLWKFAAHAQRVSARLTGSGAARHTLWRVICRFTKTSLF